MPVSGQSLHKGCKDNVTLHNIYTDAQEDSTPAQEDVGGKKVAEEENAAGDATPGTSAGELLETG